MLFDEIKIVVAPTDGGGNSSGIGQTLTRISDTL